MEQNQRVVEGLRQDVIEYEQKKLREKKDIRWCLWLYCAFLVLLFFYMRLFNTKFTMYEESLAVKYSTAWYIRYPAEYNGVKIERVIGYTNEDEKMANTLRVMGYIDYAGEGSRVYFARRCPNVKVVEVEDGITSIALNVYNYAEKEIPIQWLRLPQYIEIEGGSNHMTWPEKVTFE